MSSYNKKFTELQASIDPVPENTPGPGPFCRKDDKQSQGDHQDRPFQMRVSEDFLRVVDEWRRRQKDLPSRAEAIRRLVELATSISAH